MVEHFTVPSSSRRHVSARARAAASAGILQAFVANGIGIIDVGRAVRLPTTVAEVRAVPAFAAVLNALDEHMFILDKQRVSPSSAALAKAVRGPLSEQEEYLAALGVHVLSWLRHVNAHAYFKTYITERSGLTAAIIAAAVQASAGALVAEDAAFRWDDGGRLVDVGPQLG